VKFAFPVHFAYDDATVREQDRAALDRFAQVVNKYYNGAQITVEGFADPAGSTRYNMGLSKRRADSVREYLVSQGMSDAALRSIGYGESRQVRPGAAGTTEGAELNRRVVFVVETPANTAAVTASALPSAP
jgi:peptidoglycan-associated lipoprotein